MDRRLAPLTALILAAALALTLTACGASASYSAKVLSYQPLDPAHLDVTVQVTNTGSSAGSPDCLIQGISNENGDNGTTDVTMQGTLPPGQSTKFATSFVITSQGAADVDNVTASCT